MIERTEKEFDIVERTNHRLVKSNRELREQISELEKILIEQQDINKSLRQTPAFSNVIPVSENLCDTCVKDGTHCKYAGSSNTKINTRNFNIVECYQYKSRK